MKNQIITIFGGSGFIGSHIVKELVKTGAYIKIVSRYPEQALYLRTTAGVGQLFFQKLDIYNYDSIENAVQNSDIIINLIGILNGSEKQFTYVHTTFPKIMAKFAKKSQVKQLIHFSALGAKKAYDSMYAHSKYEGEKILLKEFPEATIIRPSTVFGSGDKFTNKLSALIALSPILLLLNHGKTKLQPVYVGDIAKAVAKIVISNKIEYKGRVFEIAGNKIYSLKSIIELLKEQLNKDIIEINVPYYLYLIVALLCECFPKPPITVDQLKLLKYNNTLDKQNIWNLEKLGIKPNALEETLQHYIVSY
jgi:uncharacterized protein YbjT (DUF2867 family)